MPSSYSRRFSSEFYFGVFLTPLICLIDVRLVFHWRHSYRALYWLKNVSPYRTGQVLKYILKISSTPYSMLCNRPPICGEPVSTISRITVLRNKNVTVKTAELTKCFLSTILAEISSFDKYLIDALSRLSFFHVCAHFPILCNTHILMAQNP